MQRLFAPIGQAIASQRGQMAEWVPVGLALGIGGYFSLKAEPAVWQWATLGGLVTILLLSMRRLPENARPLAVALLLCAIGMGLAGMRAVAVGGPVLDYRYYGPVEGRIIKIDRSASDAVRLTLDRVRLADTGPDRTPQRVRVSLHGQQGFITPEPGLRVMMTANLSPPPGPVEPGGFDFQRQAWFQRLGAVGYSRVPALTIAPADQGRAGLILHRIRARLSAYVLAALPGDTGAFAAAVTTGDRSAMNQSVMEDLRRSNLAHLLAISGLHMGLLTGLIFAVLRYGLALWQPVALRVPTKKVAAAVALVSGALYLALSGGNVATIRAFVMAMVMLVAVLMDRRALTLRAVAVAATIILVLTPEALLGPGFQMSFAATTALVAGFRALQDHTTGRLPRWAHPVLALVLSSAIAGAATAPIAAAHFNRFSNFGLIANVLSVPAMGLIVMPGAILAACLTPIGLGWLGLAIMGRGIDWILFVAHWVATLPNAQTHIAVPPGMVLPLMVLGLLWVILINARLAARGMGLVSVALALLMWSQAERPQVLVSDTGGLVGVMTGQGRSLSKPKGEGFAATSWLENDGDGADQKAAFDRVGFQGEKGDLRSWIGAVELAHITGRGAAERTNGACASAQVVIVTASIDASHGPCLLIDRDMLAATGTLSINVRDDMPVVRTARQMQGNRLWNSADARAAAGF